MLQEAPVLHGLSHHPAGDNLPADGVHVLLAHRLLRENHSGHDHPPQHCHAAPHGVHHDTEERLSRAPAEQISGVHLLSGGGLPHLQRLHPPRALPGLLRHLHLPQTAQAPQELPSLHSAPLDIHGALPVSLRLPARLHNLI